MFQLKSIAQNFEPPLKWAGGKRWLLPKLKEYWFDNENCRLVEPFAGGLAVTLGLMPERALLNDINPHLMNFYKQIRNGLAVTINVENDENLFYSHRETFNALIRTNNINNKKAAQLFYFLNRTGFNGLCRFNRSGEFNVPFGKYSTINYKKNFYNYREPFSNWEFSLGDFQNLVIEDNDFIYADPPYDVEFTSYSKENFLWKDQVRLAQWLAKFNVPIVLSNQATERIIELYKGLGFQTQFIEAPRRISCTGDRKPAREILATKNL